MTTQLTESTHTDTHNGPSAEAIAIHVLHHLTTHQMDDAARNAMRFDDLRLQLGVRRMELVNVLGRLDRQGLIDCSQLRLTLRGFSIGVALQGEQLPSLRSCEDAACENSACAA